MAITSTRKGVFSPLLPLSTGMSQSKHGLTSERLPKRNRFVSSVCSQCMAGKLAETAGLEIPNAPPGTFTAPAGPAGN